MELCYRIAFRTDVRNWPITSIPRLVKGAAIDASLSHSGRNAGPEPEV